MISALQVLVIVQCDRCKHQTEVTTPVSVANSAACGQCSAAQMVTFRASMMHENSAVLGYVDVDGCSVFDVILPECQFVAGCFTCNKEVVLQVSRQLGIVCAHW